MEIAPFFQIKNTGGETKNFNNFYTPLAFDLFKKNKSCPVSFTGKETGGHDNFSYTLDFSDRKTGGVISSEALCGYKTGYKIIENKRKKESNTRNGILKEHAASWYSNFQRGLKSNRDWVMSSLESDYKNLLKKETDNILFPEKLGTVTLDGKKIAYDPFLRGVKSGEIDPKKVYKDEAAYMKSVLNNVEEMEQKEKDYLLTLPPYENEQILYRGISLKTGDRDTRILCDEIENLSEGEAFTLQYNPVYTSTSFNFAMRYADENGMLFRIKVPKGAHLPYNEYEIILPSKSNFIFEGKEKAGNLEFVNLEYIPFEKLPR